MNLGNTHIIHKQTVDVSLTSEKNTTDIQEQLKKVLHTQSMPVIEKVLDQATDENEHIYIERLEVDMGKLDPSKATHDILSMFASKLEKAIRERLVTNKNHPNKAIDQIQKNFDSKNGVLRYTPAQAIRSAFYTYLMRGVLPAQYHPYTIQQLEKEMMERETLDETTLTGLADLSRQYPYITKRIVYQFSPSFIEKLLSIYNNFHAVYESTGLRLFHQWLWQKKMDNYLTPPLAHKLSRFLSEQLLMILFDQQTIQKKDMVRMVLESLQNASWFPKDNAEKQKWTKAIQVFLDPSDDGTENPGENFSWQLLNELKTHVNEQNYSSKAPEKERTAKKQELQEEASHDQHENSIPASKDEIKEEMAASFSREYMKSLFNEPLQDKETELYYINNAGLVLLTPYLQLFFKEIGLLNDKQFLDTEARTKAIYLLHELARGDVPANEPDLAFNKILCGMPVEMPVLPDNPVTKDEKAACEELLNAVIRNWGALKNTSPRGLREAFLQRNGKLVINESNMKLTVEKNAMDVLLAKLPWSYSIIKQPWMKQIIFVNWTK